MVNSHLQSYILTWCNGNKALLQTLQQAAHKFIKLTFKLKYCKNVMQQNHILTINQLFENELACFMYQYDHGKLPLACQVILKIIPNPPKLNCIKPEVTLNFFPAYCRINLAKQLTIKGQCYEIKYLHQLKK